MGKLFYEIIEGHALLHEDRIRGSRKAVLQMMLGRPGTKGKAVR